MYAGGMFDDANTFISLSALANRFGLPRNFLKQLADRGAIPSLDVNGRRRFNAASVEKALAELAAERQHKQTVLTGGGTCV